MRVFFDARKRKEAVTMKKPCELVKALMASEGLTREEAEDIRREMREQISYGENPEDVLADYGLEPDYIFDLI